MDDNLQLIRSDRRALFKLLITIARSISFLRSPSPSLAASKRCVLDDLGKLARYACARGLGVYAIP